jgi:uncharacterized protein (DUF302 family)
MESQSAPAVEGIVTKLSSHSVRETLDRLQKAIRGKGLTLFAHIDHGANAQAASLHMQDAQVLIFGNAKAGTPLMVASPLLALELPLRALVWQDFIGKVWVSYTDPAYLARRYAIPDDLVHNISGIEGIVDSAVGA